MNMQRRDNFILVLENLVLIPMKNFVLSLTTFCCLKEDQGPGKAGKFLKIDRLIKTGRKKY